MFNKKMNALFWMLTLTSIFFTIATINFVPLIKFVDDKWTETILQTNEINFIVLLILGLISAFISIYWIFKYFLGSQIFANSQIRKHFPSLHKKGNKLDYLILPKKSMNKLEKWETATILIAVILVLITTLLIIIIDFSVYFSMASQRVGIDFNKTSGEIINYPAILTQIKYIGLAPIFLAVIVGIFIIVSAIERKVLLEKLNKSQIKEVH